MGVCDVPGSQDQSAYMLKAAPIFPSFREIVLPVKEIYHQAVCLLLCNTIQYGILYKRITGIDRIKLGFSCDENLDLFNPDTLCHMPI